MIYDHIQKPPLYVVLIDMFMAFILPIGILVPAFLMGGCNLLAIPASL